MRHVLLLLLFYIATAAAQHSQNVIHYTENEGLAQRYVTQIVQDRQGYVWISTWNGLDRFDGYEFANFKSTSNEDNDIPSDRIMNMRLSADGNIYCLIEDHAFLFDTHSYTFRHLSAEAEKQILPSLKVSDTPPVRLSGASATDIRYCMTDKGGNRWYRSNYGVFKTVPYKRQYTLFSQEKTAQIRCLYRDKYGRQWVAGKEDKSLRLYDKHGKPLGYITPKGKISTTYTPFQAAVYCIYEDNAGNLWMGTKPDGLFRLREKAGSFIVDNILYEARSKHENNNSIYDIKQDAHGRLWIATFDKGLCCIEHPKKEIVFINQQNGLTKYPTRNFKRVRNLLITKQQTLLAATTDGLVVADLREKHLAKIKFLCHTRNIKDKNSISNNATMSVYQDSKGRIFVCTESGGVNEIVSQNILQPSLKFRHFNMSSGFPTDIVLSMFEYDKHLWAISNDKIIRIDGENKYTVFGNDFFHASIRFSDASPLLLANGSHLFGLQNGALTMNLSKLEKSSFVPPIAVTGYSIQNGPIKRVANDTDNIVLSKEERSITLYFAALDYAGSKNIEYSFSIDGKTWNYIGKTHSATFIDLAPKSYTLCVRSTNSDGVWVNNTFTIKINVTPTFWQTTTAKLLYILLFFAIISIVTYTLLYIKGINIRNKNLKAYLALIEMNNHEEKNSGLPVEKRETELLEEAKIKAADDVFMRRIVSFVEQHMADPDASIDKMADAAATSRAGLNRKIKTILGITPMDFLREVRLQRACTMLQDTNISINDVARKCGFADARYFSRIFKSKKGITPSEYRNSFRENI